MGLKLINPSISAVARGFILYCACFSCHLLKFSWSLFLRISLILGRGAAGFCWFPAFRCDKRVISTQGRWMIDDARRKPWLTRASQYVTRHLVPPRLNVVLLYPVLLHVLNNHGGSEPRVMCVIEQTPSWGRNTIVDGSHSISGYQCPTCLPGSSIDRGSYPVVVLVVISYRNSLALSIDKSPCYLRC